MVANTKPYGCRLTAARFAGIFLSDAWFPPLRFRCFGAVLPFSNSVVTKKFCKKIPFGSSRKRQNSAVSVHQLK